MPVFNYNTIHVCMKCDTTAFRMMLILLTGYVFGGDVLRLFHGHMDECLAIPEAGSENEFK